MSVESSLDFIFIIYIELRKGRFTGQHKVKGCAKLIFEGADVLVLNNLQRITLHEAASQGRTSLAKLLLERHVTPNAQGDDLCTALHYASLHGHPSMVRLLLENGADHTIADKFNAQPLFRAAGMGYTEVVRILLDKGAYVNALDNYGNSALHGPSETSDVSVQRLLLKRGADVNVRSDAGATPLHGAVDVGNMSNVRLLLEFGAKTNIVDNDQNTPFCKAIQRDHDSIAEELLRQPDVDINSGNGVALQEAVARGKIDLVREMLDHEGVNVNVQDGQYGSVVGAAACNGSIDMLRLLIEHGADVNIQGGEFGCALQAAAFYAHVDVLNMLLDHGAVVITPGGRYGSVYSAARKSKASKEKKDEVLKLLDGTGIANVAGEGHREFERWVLTPGGWTWVPTPGHDETYPN